MVLSLSKLHIHRLRAGCCGCAISCIKKCKISIYEGEEIPGKKMETWILVHHLYSKTIFHVLQLWEWWEEHKCKYPLPLQFSREVVKRHITFFLPIFSPVIHKMQQSLFIWIWIATFYLLLLKTKRKPHRGFSRWPICFHDENKNWCVTG